MSVKRRLVTAGMPAAGVTVLAALALTGQPANAATVNGSTLSAAHHVVAANPQPGGSDTDASGGGRGNAGYGSTAADTDPDATAGDGDTAADGDTVDDGTDTAAGSGAGATEDPSDSSGGSDTDNSGGGRGNDGYGGVSPSESPTPTPTTPSPTVSPRHDKPTKVSPAGDTLPLTGAPVGMITTIGVLLAAAGAGIMVALRRRRSV